MNQNVRIENQQALWEIASMAAGNGTLLPRLPTCWPTQEQWQAAAEAIAAAEREKIRLAILEEAKKWNGDHRSAAWLALTDLASAINVKVTKDDCYRALKAHVEIVELAQKKSKSYVP